MKQEKGIKILGSGCKKCVALEETIQKAVHEMNLDISIEHVKRFVSDKEVDSYSKSLKIGDYL